MRAEDVPSTGLNAFITELAARHGVFHAKTGSDALAQVISGLAGDEIVTDATEDALVALRRANIIDGPTMGELMNRYLTAKFHAV